MPGDIVRALDWDRSEQRFLATNPLADEVTLWETRIGSSSSYELSKLHTFTGVEHIQCMSYLRRHFGWCGVGTMDGHAHIFDITLGSTLKLKLKQPRPCNALLFNSGQLVLASFDKSRQDSSLQVWDLGKQAHVFTEGFETSLEGPPKPSYGYLLNEATVLAVFSSDPSGMVLMAGGYKLLREFDLRSPAPTFQVATKCTMKLSLDPFDQHMFASMSDDGLLLIWDRRKIFGGSNKAPVAESPALYFPKLLADALRRGALPCFRYLSVRRGEFAAVVSDDLIRRWNTGVVAALPGLETDAATFSGPAGNLKTQSAQLYPPAENLLFVAAVVDCKPDLPRVTAFDYLEDGVCHTLTNFVCMREKGLVFRMPVVESVEALHFNPKNEFSMAGPEGTYTHFGELHETAVAPNGGGKPLPHAMGELRLNLQSPNAPDESKDDLKEYADDDELEVQPWTMVELSDVTLRDICSVIRARAQAGYAVDTDHNFDVLVASEPAGASLLLRSTWKWIGLARKSLEKGTMVKAGVDLGYVGILAMWKGVEELRGQNRTSDRGHVSEEMFADAVRAIVARKGEKLSGISIFSLSDRKLQRKLCLIVSGWYLTAHEFDKKIEELVSNGQVEKAAGWAVFHGDVSRAITILAQLKTERLQLMLTAVAGYLAYKDLSVNLPWNDQCRRLLLELDNPYLRAIFAFIADNDWWDVLDEHALPLRERLGIAIRFLSDKDLNVYLNRVADAVVAKGELEGLILTGLTPRAIDLLQLYVDKTLDVQTAALIAQFAVPRYFRDVRVDHWTQSYRELLNLWGFFKERARFDVARSRSSRTSAGTATIRPAPRQVYLQCNLCKKNMATSVKAKGPTKWPRPRTSLFNVCQHCGAPLPRCAICLLTLGTQIPAYVDLKREDLHENFHNKFSFCLSCTHGYHAHHAEEWFSKHYVCPVPDCNCRCNSK